MILTRTPFRITLGGGGTDLPSFYQEHGGYILAVTLDKYMFLNVNTPILDDKIRVRYTSFEMVDHVDDVKHTLAREALRHFHITSGIEIVSIADIPAGTGLGSSSAYLIGLLNALHALVQDQATPQRLAEEACHIELDTTEEANRQAGPVHGRLRRPNGARHQDQTAPSCGPSCVSTSIWSKIWNDNILMFYTNEMRDATTILKKQDDSTRDKESRSS